MLKYVNAASKSPDPLTRAFDQCDFRFDLFFSFSFPVIF